MSRRAIGITSYYNRVTPVYPTTRPRTVKRDKPKGIKELPMTLDVTSPEVRKQEQEDKLFLQVDLVGQAVAALVIFLLPLVIVAQIGIWLGWW